MESKPTFTAVNVTKILGVVADVRRDHENDFGSEKCCIFGLSQDEFAALEKVARKMAPREFNMTTCDRVMVHCSAWRAMRVLGENFGYTLTVTPIGGRVEGPTGERRTCIWTLVSAVKPATPNPL